MQVVALRTLRRFWERGNPQAEKPLRAWHTIVTGAEWNGPADVKDQFGTTVDFVADNRLIFNISGNKYRLIVRVSYEYKSVLVKFVGPHAEYYKIDPVTCEIKE